MSGRSVSVSRRSLAAAASLGLALGFVGFFVPEAVQASSGSYSLNFAAANPLDYSARSPAQLACPALSGSSGRLADPLAGAAFGDPKAYVESLTPKDLTLGQIVAFEAKIGVSGSTAPEGGAISFSADWLAKTTSGDDFGFDTSQGLYCAFVDTADTATTDTGHNAKVLSYTSSTVGTGTNNERIAGTVDVTGLDDGDSVVVELWVVLDKTIPAGAGGNVQTSITGAHTSTGDGINVGAQMVPLKNVQEFLSQPGLGIDKSAQESSYSKAGDLLHYTYLVTNTGNVTLTDPISVTDDKTAVSCPALPAGGLTPKATITCTATYQVTQADVDTGHVTNSAFATSGSVQSPPDSVTVPAVQGRALAIDKSVQESAYSKVGDVLHYTYVVTNAGNVTLTDPITVTDNKTTVTCPALPVGGLLPKATITCTATYVVTQADLDAGSVTNSAYAKSGAVQSPPDTATVPATQVRALTIDKTVREPAYYSVGDVLHYTYVVTNVGSVTLKDPVTVTDTKTTVSCPALPAAGLAPGASLTCTATYTVTAADVLAGRVTNSAYAKSGTTQSPPDTVTLPLVTAVLGHVTVVKQLEGTVAGAESTFTFNVLCPTANYAATLTVDASSGSGSASTPDVLPVGAACQISEVGTYPHWTLTSAAPSAPGAPTVATASAGAGSNAADTTTFVNSRVMGTVNVTKTRVGDVAGAGTDFTFQLTCPAYVTAAGPQFPWAQQTLTVDTSAHATAVAVSDPIPTGVECDVVEVPTDGWQQTDPAAGAGVTVTVPVSASFTNTRNAGALQLIKTVHSLAGPNQNVGSYVAGDPDNTLVYTLTLSEAQPGQLDHTGVVVTDYLPGYGPDAGEITTTYVEGSATCSTGCTVTYDAAEHQLSWDVGSFGHADAPVVVTFRVTIDPPPVAADGAIPAATLTNVGWVDSLQQVDTPSNSVKTPITAVLGEKKTVPLPLPLPFTGAPVPVPLAWHLGVLLIGVGVALLVVQRRRRDQV